MSIAADQIGYLNIENTPALISTQRMVVADT